MNTFAQDLEEAVSYHGHFCIGQVIGVRMARLALRLLGFDGPRPYPDLIVYVECDRCLTDAVGTVTGCKLGRRTMKWVDYGKSAATFVNIATGEALRISSLTLPSPPADADLITYFDDVPDEALFAVRRVKVELKPEDLPGTPRGSVICATCGEKVRDARHIMRGEQTLCKACAEGAYYTEISDSDPNLS